MSAWLAFYLGALFGAIMGVAVMALLKGAKEREAAWQSQARDKVPGHESK